MDPLFQAAVDYAVRSGRIKNPRDVSEERSRNTGASFVLAKSDGTVLARIEIDVVRSHAKAAIANVANSALLPGSQQSSSAGSGINRPLTSDEYEKAADILKAYGRPPASIEHSEVTWNAVILRDDKGRHIVNYPLSFFNPLTGFTTSNRSKAVAWARSVGYPVPQKPNGCLSAIAIITGLLIFVVPGLMLIIWVSYNNKVYNREMDALVAKWIDAGRPDPGVKSNVDNKIAVATASMSTAEQLGEYKRMHDQGLISAEEHEALRKKALGL